MYERARQAGAQRLGCPCKGAVKRHGGAADAGNPRRTPCHTHGSMGPRETPVATGGTMTAMNDRSAADLALHDVAAYMRRRRRARARGRARARSRRYGHEGRGAAARSPQRCAATRRSLARRQRARRRRGARRRATTPRSSTGSRSTPRASRRWRAACSRPSSRCPIRSARSPTSRYRPSGIQVGQMRVPLGVVGIIYESRPNVTADAAALCLKSGNATILRGGSEALRSNHAIAACVHEGLRERGAARGRRAGGRHHRPRRRRAISSPTRRTSTSSCRAAARASSSASRAKRRCR